MKLKMPKINNNITVLVCFPQTVQYPGNTANGCMAYSVTRRRARGTGLAGTARPPNSCASVGCCTTKNLTPATGPRTSRDVRNTVSTPTPVMAYIIYYVSCLFIRNNCLWYIIFYRLCDSSFSHSLIIIILHRYKIMCGKRYNNINPYSRIP